MTNSFKIFRKKTYFFKDVQIQFQMETNYSLSLILFQRILDIFIWFGNFASFCLIPTQFEVIIRIKKNLKFNESKTYLYVLTY